MQNPALIARQAGFALSTVDVPSLERCLDIAGNGRLLATLLWDGKPRRAHVDGPIGDDRPVGWCLQFSDQLREGEPVIWCISCESDRLDLVVAIACGMIQMRLHETGWWEPLPDNRLWNQDNPSRVKSHMRMQLDPEPTDVAVHDAGLL